MDVVVALVFHGLCFVRSLSTCTNWLACFPLREISLCGLVSNYIKRNYCADRRLVYWNA